MDLIETAKAMKKNAVEFAYQTRDGKPLGTFANPAAFVLAQKQLRESQRVAQVDGYDIRLSFTSDTLQSQHAWHLSMSREDGENLPEETVNKVVSTFFPGDTKYPEGRVVEIPSLMHGKRVRQFLRLEDEV